MCQRFILVTEPEYQRLTQTSGALVPEPADVSVLSDPKLVSQLLEILPAKLKNAATPLLAAFQQRYPTDLTWDPKTGEISVRGEKISNSNITDIIRYLLLPWQRSSSVRGTAQVVKLLKDTNFPALLIRNPKVRQELLLDPIPESAVSPSTPQSSAAKESDKSRVWLRWR